MDPTPLIPGIRRNDDGSYTMCSKNGCCPQIKFEVDGSAVISDEGQSVTFTPEQLTMLGQIVMMRGWKG